QGLERPLDGRDEVLVGEVEVRTLAHDAGLGLDDPLRALGGGEVERLGEAALAAVEVGPVDVGVVEERDPRVARGPHERADLVVGLVLDAHEAEHDVRDDEVGAGEGEGLHGCSSFAGAGPEGGRHAAESRATSSGVRVRSAARTESRIDAGRDAPGMGTTTGASASSHASVTW